MYWYSVKKVWSKAVMGITIAALFLSCESNSTNIPVGQEKYIDIPAYFKAEVERLTRENPLIKKTVIKDSLSETKELKIADWENELSSFASIDLNKPAYIGALTKDSASYTVKIKSTDPKIDIVEVEITYTKEGDPITFQIQRNIKNSLYETREKLQYTKQEGYSLEKQQSVLILGDKYYHIQGYF